MKIDIALLEHRIEKKLINKQVMGDLTIYNYTPEATWKKEWDQYVKMCRGLILKSDGTVVARPFPKFFNLQEQESTTIRNLPRYQPEVMEKMDGSLGILYHDGWDYRIATRGSFKSDQAIWATKWLQNKGAFRDYLENVTYLFEIIYPENRIVVNYGDREELVLIGLVHNWTGKIYSYKDVKQEGERLGFSYPQQFEMSVIQIKEKAEEKRNGDEEEGFVLFYPEENLQIKVKYKDYVKLHRLIFGISVRSIWETMKDGKNVEDVFADAPDEVLDWVKEWKHLFRTQEQFHLAEATKHLAIVEKLETRKEQAIYLQKEAMDYLSIVFSLLDNKPYLNQIYQKFAPNRDDAAKSFKVVPKGDL